MKDSYELIDSGNQKKFERFGPYTLIRPCSQALWRPKLNEQAWSSADGVFTRKQGNRWDFKKKVPSTWTLELQGIKFKLCLTDFGHIGIFPEHAMLWQWAAEKIKSRKEQVEILNLFAYSGAATLALAKAGAKVCHLDASKAAVEWARENARANEMQSHPIRWIVEDVIKFLKREHKRGKKYQGILLDPPSFGRGNKAEVFVIEQDLPELLKLCVSLLADDALFFILSTHTPGMTPLVLQHLLEEVLHQRGGVMESGELVIFSKEGRDLPSGGYARWSPKN